MAEYDNKLGEWFKQVEKRAEELLARKRGEDTPREAASAEEHRRPAVSPSPRGASPSVEVSTNSSGGNPSPGVSSGGIAESRPDAPLSGGISESRPDGSVLTVVDTREAVAEVAVADKPEPATHPDAGQRRSPALFEDTDVPPVEDFFSFLSRTGEHKDESSEDQLPLESARDQGMSGLSEGTGTPRPIAVAPEQTVEQRAVVARPMPTPEPAQPAAKPQPSFEAAEPVAKLQPAPAEAARVTTPAQSTAEQKWERVPQHLRILFDGEVDEIAQHSYKTFRESRTSLIGRLLDPSVTLEDAARILNVCPTTVRRYTNRGILKHYRTAGNQRRFKLSDVLAFMDSKQLPAE